MPCSDAWTKPAAARRGRPAGHRAQAGRHPRQMMLRLGDGKLRAGLVDEAASIGARASRSLPETGRPGHSGSRRHLLERSSVVEAWAIWMPPKDTTSARYRSRSTPHAPPHCRCVSGWAPGLARGDHAQAKAISRKRSGASARWNAWLAEKARQLSRVSGEDVTNLTSRISRPCRLPVPNLEAGTRRSGDPDLRSARFAERARRLFGPSFIGGAVCRWRSA